MFQSLIMQLDRHPAARHLLFLVATCLSVVVAGYHFGTFDQAIHIPFLRKNVNPALYPNDPFFEMRFQHYSFFWHFFQPIYRAGLLEISLFVGHVLATYATFWAIWSLSQTLFNKTSVALLSVLTFIMPPISFGGFPLIEFSLLNRTFVFPFLLLALILFLRRRHILAFLLLGLLFNLHVISVNFVMGMLVFYCLFHWRAVGRRKLVLGGLVFIIAAAPVLRWRASDPLSGGLTPHADWFRLVSDGMLYHLFFPFSSYLHVLLPTLSGLSALFFFWMAYQHAPRAKHSRQVAFFMAAVVLIISVQVVAALLFPITILMQLQIIRAGLFATLFGYLFFVNYLVSRYEEGSLTQLDFAWVFLSLALSPFAVVPLVIFGLTYLIKNTRWRYGLVTAALLILVPWSAGYIIQLNLWEPGIHLYGPQDDWQAAQIWASEHTPLEANFITPPHLWGVYDAEWRVFSERSTFVTLSELLEIALVPSYVDTWKHRFELLAPGALAQFEGHYFENVALTTEAFYSLSTAELVALGQDYQLDYLVVEKPHAHPLPLVYENEGFRIYELPPP